MKKIIICVFLSITLILTSACSNFEQEPNDLKSYRDSSVENVSQTVTEKSDNPKNDVAEFPLEQPYFAPTDASSIEEYYNNASKEKTAVPDCYILKNKPEKAEITRVTYREGVYVYVNYYIPLDEKYKDMNLDEYSIERITSIICQHKVDGDGETSFKLNILDTLDTNGYEKTEANGKDYYYQTEYSSDGKNIIGYQVEFLENGERIFLHLPPLDTFENMTEYLEVVKAEPESGDSISADN